MGCGINILVNSKEDGKQVQQVVSLKEKTAGNTDKDIQINMDQVVELITQLPQTKRTQLAAMLRVAKNQSLTEKDCAKYQFVSNTDVETLQSQYPDLKELYPDVQSLDNCTLVRCNNMKLNGKTYFGRVIQANGEPAFFISDKNSARKFLQYLDTKNKIQKAVSDNTLEGSLKEYQEEFTALTQHYNKSEVQLLLDYLDNADAYMPYKDGTNLIIPSKTINRILSKIQNTYNSDLGKSDMELAIAELSSKTHDNRFEYKIPLKKIHQVLSNYIQDFMSFEEFNKLSQEELQNTLHEAFLFDPRLRKYRIKTIEGGVEKSVTKAAKEKKISQKEMNEKWQELKKQMKAQDVTLGALKTMAEQSPEQTVAHLKTLFSDLNPTITIQDGKITATYKTEESLETKETPKTIILESPYSTLGQVYDFGYSSTYMFSPVTVDQGADTLGMYHGMYLYQYFDPKSKTTHYAISRSIISPNSYAQTFNSIEGAKAKIDYMNDNQTLAEAGLYSMKKYSTRQRQYKLEMKNVNEGQIITSLDLELPRYKMRNLPPLFRGLFTKTAKDVRAVFSHVDGIESINTPEKAAAFLYLFTQQTRTADNMKVDINQIIKENTETAKNIIDQINKTQTVSYLVEKLSRFSSKEKNKQPQTFALVTYLENNGNSIDVSGKFGDVRGDNPSVSSMESAVNYFREKFGVQFHTMSNSELSQFPIDNGNTMDLSGARAFIYNGEIYINSSNANLSDIFHEMAHIFFGALKVKYSEAYQHIMEKYSKTKKFERNISYIDKAYNRFAYQDKVEECVVDMIADDMFNKQRLINGFKGEEFLQDLEDIFTNFPKELQSPKQSGLSFDTYMNEAIKSTSDQIKKNMRISNLIGEAIKNGRIKEKCD